MKILVLFYSAYGHTYKMARAVKKGAEKIEDITVDLKKVPETVSDDILKQMGAYKFKESISDIPVIKIEELKNYSAIIFGTPTRFGNMCGQMRAFLDSTGPLWQEGALIGKIGSVFTSTATQHGGQESTILSFHISLLHHGMIIVGLPYSFQGQMRLDEISGCSPYGASTIAGGDGSRLPSSNEIEAAKFQGEHIAKITQKLFS